MANKNSLQVLMADDDQDDQFFFKIALAALTTPTELTTVNDGEELLEYLTQPVKVLPDILFLDINMPRKNGFESLREIKANPRLAKLPVVIYSTAILNTIADNFFNSGAHYFLSKREPDDLQNFLEFIFNLYLTTDFIKPPRSKFILNAQKPA